MTPISPFNIPFVQLSPPDEISHAIGRDLLRAFFLYNNVINIVFIFRYPRPDRVAPSRRQIYEFMQKYVCIWPFFVVSVYPFLIAINFPPWRSVTRNKCCWMVDQLILRMSALFCGGEHCETMGVCNNVGYLWMVFVEIGFIIMYRIWYIKKYYIIKFRP